MKCPECEKDTYEGKCTSIVLTDTEGEHIMVSVKLEVCTCGYKKCLIKNEGGDSYVKSFYPF